MTALTRHDPPADSSAPMAAWPAGEIELWTLPDCPRCEKAGRRLREAGLPYALRSIEALRRGEIQDVDALAYLVLSDGQAPMIRVDGRFVTRAEFEDLLAEAER